jgi:hypothetical protein
MMHVDQATARRIEQTEARIGESLVRWVAENHLATPADLIRIGSGPALDPSTRSPLTEAKAQGFAGAVSTGEARAIVARAQSPDSPWRGRS